MKPINKLAVAALLALSSVGMASATTTVVHVTGSTAYRVADVTAETTYLNGLGSGGVTAVYFDSGGSASLTHAAKSIVYGPTVSGNQTIFENVWTGSVGGTEALVSPISVAFPLNTSYTGGAVTLGNSTTASSGGTLSTDGATPAHTESKAPDIAFCDVSFDTCSQIISQSTVPNNLGTPNDIVVGVVPFVFVANGSSDILSKLTGLSMSPQLYTYTWNNGNIPLSFFTGSSSDETSTVYALGRDVDSGTRSSTLAETGYGLSGSGIVTTPVIQYFPYNNATNGNNDVAAGNDTTTGVVGIDSAATVIGAINFVPEENLDGVEMPTGDGGYFSGGNLATAMSATFSGVTKTAMMTSLGVSDAVSALKVSAPQPAKLMSYNGVTFDPTTTASAPLIEEGKYTFWGYEHEYYFGASTTPVGKAATGVQGQLTGGIDQVSADGVTIGAMKVGRTDDGQNVTPGNPF